jgi:hypothetical protein
MGLRNFTVTVTRYAPSTYDSTTGKMSDNESFTSDIKCSIQPINGEDMKANPSLRDAEKTYRVYTSFELLTAQEAKGQADSMIVFGETFEVIKVEPWQNGIKSHYKAYIQKV